MCSPLITGIVSTAVSAYGQYTQYQAQAEANAIAQEQAIKSAADYKAYNTAQINERQLEDREQIANENTNFAINALRQAGTATAMSDNAGLSYDMLSLDYSAESDRYYGTQERNLAMIDRQANADRYAVDRQAEAKANSVSSYQPSFNWFSALAPGIAGSIIGNMADKQASGLTFKNSTTTKKIYEEV